MVLITNLIRMASRLTATAPRGEVIAAVLRGRNHAEMMVEEMPEVKPDEVLLEMGFVCVSRQDVQMGTLGVLKGGQPIHDRHVLCSQGTGLIIEMGNLAHGHLKRGDRVVVEPLMYCGECYACSKKWYHSCLASSMTGVPPRNGLLKTHYTHPWRFIHKLPDNVSLVDGSYTVRVAIALNVYKQSGAGPHSNVAVLGASFEGCIATKIFSTLGVKNLIVIDTNNYHLYLAKKVGAHLVFNTRQRYPPLNIVEDLVRACFDGHEADIVIDTIHSEPSFLMTSTIIKEFGTVVLTDAPSVPDGFNIINALDETGKQLALIESIGYGEQFKNALAFLEQHNMSEQLPPFVIPMHRALDAFTYSRSKMQKRLTCVIDCKALNPEKQAQ